MTILLYKDGRLVIDDGNPIEGNSLEGLVACVTDPQSGDTLKFDGKQWVAGAAASGLPDISGDDDGKVLTVVEGEWAPAAGGGGGSSTLLVEVTVDGAHETFNKTAGEIYQALDAGTPVLVKWPANEYAGVSYSASIATAIDLEEGQITHVAFIVFHPGQNGFVHYSTSSMSDYPSAYFY